MTKKYKEEVAETMNSSAESEQVEQLGAEEELHEVPEVEVIEPEEEDGLDDEERLQKKLAEAEKEKDEFLNGWQRAQADFVNYKKRVERDRQQMQQNATGNVVRRYLDILDDLERALANQPQDGEGAAWAGGIELVYRKWLNALDADGIKPMETENQIFDPTLHEAITQEESPDHESGEIIEIVQTGYMIGDRVLRPAKARVAQ